MPGARYNQPSSGDHVAVAQQLLSREPSAFPAVARGEGALQGGLPLVLLTFLPGLEGDGQGSPVGFSMGFASLPHSGPPHSFPGCTSCL